MAANKFKPKATANPVEETPEMTMVEAPAVEEVSAPEVQEPDVAFSPSAPESTEEDTPEVTFDSEPSSKAPAERNVKVCLTSNHTCSIGGVRYYFEKGKPTNVPESVKAILKKAGLLAPI